MSYINRTVSGTCCVSSRGTRVVAGVNHRHRRLEKLLLIATSEEKRINRKNTMYTFSSQQRVRDRQTKMRESCLKRVGVKNRTKSQDIQFGHNRYILQRVGRSRGLAGGAYKGAPSVCTRYQVDYYGDVRTTLYHPFRLKRLQLTLGGMEWQA